KFPAESLLPEIEALYVDVKGRPNTEDYKKAESSIAGTLGNMYYQLGNQSYDRDKEKSLKYYEKAKAIFLEAPVKTKWTWFGYGESCFRLEDYEEAKRCFLQDVIPEAEFEYSTRPEPRTKVLGQSTVLICSMKVADLNDDVNALYNMIKTTLGSVDESVTIYSQFQRRNVSKKRFLEDLNDAMAAY